MSYRSSTCAFALAAALMAVAVGFLIWSSVGGTKT